MCDCSNEFVIANPASTLQYATIILLLTLICYCSWFVIRPMCWIVYQNIGNTFTSECLFSHTEYIVMRYSVSTVLESCYMFYSISVSQFSYWASLWLRCRITSTQPLLVFLQCVLCYKQVADFTVGLLCVFLWEFDCSAGLCLQY